MIKIIALAVFSTAVFFLPLWLMAAILLLAVLLTQISLRKFFSALRGGIIFMIILFIFNVLLADYATALTMAGRWGLLFGGAVWLALTTPPRALLLGVKKLLSPLARFNVPVNDGALMVVLLARFLTILKRERQIIIAAQRARGLNPSSRIFSWHNLNVHTAWIMPLLFAAFRRAHTLSNAIISRRPCG